MKKQFFTLLLVVFSLLSSATAWGQVCKIGAISFDKLEDALAYVNSYPDQEMTIIMLTDYTLPAGTYTLPAKATLVVPKSDEQETGSPNVELISHNSAKPENTWEKDKPTEFRRLTFDKDVNMNVYGTIELSGKLHASSDDYTSSPYGPYGLLHMNEGAKMTLMDRSELRAWGFMTGKGETDARRGSTVREIFQMGDWKGGKISKMLLGSDKGVFPVTQYYIQNIESPVKYHPGAKLSTMAAVSADLGGNTSVTATADVAIIGVSGTKSMFLMDEEADQENTWVRKWYDTTKDQQVYEINSGAHIGSIVIDLGDFIEGSDLEMNSSAFVLPLTNNMKIHLLSGLMDFTQNTALLPGAEVEINKKSVVSITKNSDPNVKSGSLYIYDADQWGKYAYAMDEDKKDEYKYTKVVRYTPSAENGQPTVRNVDSIPDASINVHGTFDTKDGYIFTSVNGANIFSTDADAGTFVFTTEAKSIEDTVQVWQVNEAGKLEAKPFVSAKLINKDLSYTETAGTEILRSYCYMDSIWRQLDYVNCYTIDGNIFSATPVVNAVYAKPQEYVEIAINGIDMERGEFIGNSDHTFSDADGKGRLFILVEENCQWWEVKKVDGEENLFQCIHPLNNTYYYWDKGDEENGENGEWAEKRNTITWLNWDGTPIKDADGNEINYTVPYGTMAEYLGTNPTKPMDEGYTYTFTGWTPALAPVTKDTTYTAVYASTPRKYTVTLKSDVEGACSFTGAGAYDYNTTATISATMNPDYQFVGWEHDNTLGMSFTTTVTGDVTYTVRTSPAATIIRDGLTAGNYYTICMTKAMKEIQGATLWSFYGKDANFAYLVQEDAPYTAGMAYIMYAEAEKVSAILTGEPAPAPVANGAIYGTFVEMNQAALDAAGDNIYLVIGNELRRVDDQTGNSLPANRAYVDIDEITVGAPAGIPANRVRSMPMQPQVATGMENVDASAQPVKTIINGQLFILRGEKMYDAQGKLVK